MKYNNGFVIDCAHITQQKYRICFQIKPQILIQIDNNNKIIGYIIQLY